MNNIPNELSGKDNTATYDDILNNTEIYEKILTLPDEIAISQYITSLRQVARQYKLPIKILITTNIQKATIIKSIMY